MQLTYRFLLTTSFASLRCSSEYTNVTIIRGRDFLNNNFNRECYHKSCLHMILPLSRHRGNASLRQTSPPEPVVLHTRLMAVHTNISVTHLPTATLLSAEGTHSFLYSHLHDEVFSLSVPLDENWRGNLGCLSRCLLDADWNSSARGVELLEGMTTSHSASRVTASSPSSSRMAAWRRRPVLYFPSDKFRK